MEFLGIGPLELLLILVVALILLGPKDMLESTKKVARGIRKFTQSSTWRDVVETSQEIRELPQKIIKETGIEEDLKEIRKSTRPLQTEMREWRSGQPRPRMIPKSTTADVMPEITPPPPTDQTPPDNTPTDLP
ncbi:MAG TPA: twin-arginine translocase TatA/TatE family subunit [Longilinea sp.]|nr:twin-arginine translocase TatA/TatE family subunit [Longilinea sp.]